MPQRTESKNNREKHISYGAISLAWNLGYIIAIPLVISAFSGRFLDNKYSTSPIFLISGILLAIAISGILIFRKIKIIMDEFNK